MSRTLRWTEHAVGQLATIAEHISLVSPVYAEQAVDRIIMRLRQAQEFPESGRGVPETDRAEIRELLEWPHRLIYRVEADAITVLAIVHGRQDLVTHLPI